MNCTDKSGAWSKGLTATSVNAGYVQVTDTMLQVQT